MRQPLRARVGPRRRGGVGRARPDAAARISDLGNEVARRAQRVAVRDLGHPLAPTARGASASSATAR
eukprot:8399268-Alexandrium_andersonii.AAC.1